jgi:hypothetical protein
VVILIERYEFIDTLDVWISAIFIPQRHELLRVGFYENTAPTVFEKQPSIREIDAIPSAKLAERPSGYFEPLEDFANDAIITALRIYVRTVM